MRISRPPAGSRPASTSQNESFVRTPVPSGAGHAMSGSVFVSAVDGTGARRAGVLRVCARLGAPAIASAAIRRSTRGMTELYQLRRGPQVGVEELVDALPRIAQYVLAREVVELARVRHERDEAALAFLQKLIHEPY